jgi:hypothetical protein
MHLPPLSDELMSLPCGLNEGAKKTAATPVLAPPPMVYGCGPGVSRILFTLSEAQ